MAQLNIYYQTTYMSEDQLKESISSAKSQEDYLLIIFKAFKELTASQAHEYYMEYSNKHRTPLTSIRRAITNLYNRGVLVKCEKHQLSQYNKPEHFYKITV